MKTKTIQITRCRKTRIDPSKRQRELIHALIENRLEHKRIETQFEVMKDEIISLMRKDGVEALSYGGMICNLCKTSKFGIPTLGGKRKKYWLSFKRERIG